MRLGHCTPYEACVLDTNLFRARVGQREPNGLTRLATDGAELAVADCAFEGEVFAVVDPREITLSLGRPSGSARNVMSGRVVDLQPEPPSGDRVMVGIGSHP